MSTQEQKNLLQVHKQFNPQDYLNPYLNEDEIIKIKEIFDTFDQDKQGIILLSELKKAIQALGMEAQASKIMQIAENLEKEQENNINFEQFLHLFGFTKDFNDESNLKDLFNQFDTNLDGLVSLDDFQRISNLVGEKFTQNELNEMVQYADKDKDGFINFDEFKTVINNYYSQY
ncbi:hypothetical protein PPERSA_06206 [Pseudocohnilembus persalinus]|uniref:Calmodulin n=1 Tax=Pseudocohnilembus persalinus TaxID=266149 RepID=A0A0V0R0H7_PSEPJ|nr:hypothetical protein PPERSA_06206 [Pseudocohnilembus persalinus]|eukprot:KRX08028.1 hypothetical protein PPERSA_06206 [Pseudocohnilembus persalinus]